MHGSGHDSGHSGGTRSKGVLLKLDKGFRILLAREQAWIEEHTGQRVPRTNLMRDLMRNELKRRAESRGESIPHAEPANLVALALANEADHEAEGAPIDVGDEDAEEVTQVGRHVAAAPGIAPARTERVQDGREAPQGPSGASEAPQTRHSARQAVSVSASHVGDITPVAVGRSGGQGGFVGDIKLVGTTSGVKRGE